MHFQCSAVQYSTLEFGTQEAETEAEAEAGAEEEAEAEVSVRFLAGDPSEFEAISSRPASSTQHTIWIMARIND